MRPTAWASARCPATSFSAHDPDIQQSDIWLHNLNVRLLVVKENEDCFCGVPLPAITVGIHCKYNETISQINDRLGGALTGIGYRSRRPGLHGHGHEDVPQGLLRAR